MKEILMLFLMGILSMQCQNNPKPMSEENKEPEVVKDSSTSEEDWKKILSPEEYYVLREKGTERPFTGEYDVFFEDGTYNCKACGEPLFTSDAKFNSGCGWPSFDQGIADGKIIETPDNSHGMRRTEITCANCGSHLGHVFEDGPTDTGLRYCVNSVSLDFTPEDEKATETNKQNKDDENN